MIVFNAFACDPEMGSEAGLGWNWFTYVARRYRTHLITAGRGREKILLDAIAEDTALSQNATVHFIQHWEVPTDPFRSFLFKFYQPYYYTYYRGWMRKAFLHAAELCRTEKVKAVHQNTFHSFREPGDFWRLAVPSIWAPVGGTTDVPWRFLWDLGPMDAARHSSRNLINAWHKRFNRRFKKALAGYTKVVAGSDNAAELFRKFRPDVEMIPGQLIQEPKKRGRAKSTLGNECLDICFCGNHWARKGGHFALLALAIVGKQRSWRLQMIGEGEMTERWKTLSRKIGIDDRVTWHGRVSRKRVKEIMVESDVFLFPSLNDCYPAVIGEALSVGLPVITTDIPGVGDMVGEKSGYRLHADTPNGLVRRLSDSIIRLIEDPVELERIRSGVSLCTKEFLFENKMKLLEGIYQEILRKN